MKGNLGTSRLVHSNQADGSLTDAAAIASVLAGDVDGFEPIVRRYYPAMLRTAFMRIGDQQAAEDIVQESLLAAYRSLHSYDSKYSFRTWLWAILLNESRRKYRQLKKQPTVSSSKEAVGGESESESQAQDIEDAEQLELAMQLVNRLPVKQAEAIRLRFAGELKYREIAAVAGCSLATAKNRVKAGLVRLGQLLNSEKRITKDQP